MRVIMTRSGFNVEISFNTFTFSDLQKMIESILKNPLSGMYPVIGNDESSTNAIRGEETALPEFDGDGVQRVVHWKHKMTTMIR